MCRVKAVLPPESHDGWVKIYAGQRGEVEDLVSEYIFPVCIEEMFTVIGYRAWDLA